MTSYRDIANHAARYQAKLRDRMLGISGIEVIVKVPTVENTITRYGDVDSTTTIRESTISVIPRYESYYSILSVLGASAEDELPLEVVIPTSFNLPKGSYFDLSVQHLDDDSEAKVVTWSVLSTEFKHIEIGYSKIASCVPRRILEEEETPEPDPMPDPDPVPEPEPKPDPVPIPEPDPEPDEFPLNEDGGLTVDGYPASAFLLSRRALTIVVMTDSGNEFWAFIFPTHSALLEFQAKIDGRALTSEFLESEGGDFST